MFRSSTVLQTIILVLTVSTAGWTATYYVDATSGNDSNDGLSTPTAWKTIAKVNASQFQPGDFILFKRDEVWREQLSVPSSGSSGNPIVVSAYGNGDHPVINGANLISPGSSWKQLSGNIWWASVPYTPYEVYFDETRGKNTTAIEFLDETNEWFWSGETLYVYSTSDPDDSYTSPGVQLPWRTGVEFNAVNYVTVSNVNITMSYYGIAGINGDTSITITDCEVSNNFSNGIIGFDADGPTSASWLIDNCIIHHNGGAGIFIGKNTNNFTVSNNTIYNNCDSDMGSSLAGVKTQYETSTNHRIERNLLYLNGENTTIQYNGAGVWIDESGDGNIVRYNKSYSNRHSGIIVETTSNTDVYYNICYSNDPTGSSFGNGIVIQGVTSNPADTNAVYNNVCYDNYYSGIFVQGNGANSVVGNLVRNNISINNGRRELACETGGDNDGTVGSGNIYTHNCFGVESSDFIEWGTVNTLPTYSAWETAYGSETYSAEADPLFTDEAAYNFFLLANSPCINVGTNVGLTQDFAGNAIYGNPDMGAYEFMYISPPKNLRVE